MALAAFFLASATGSAKACFPETAPAHLIGKYFVHEYPTSGGAPQIRTSVIAGRSPEGGLISCFYNGRPGALGELQTILATDENYSFAWSLDPRTGQRQVSNAEERACDLGSLGPCTARRPGDAPGRPTLVQEWDRRCEGGSWVKIRLSLRYEGGDARLRAMWNAQVGRYPKRRSEIRYREDGAILSTVTQVGLRRTAPSRLIEEGEWTGPSCLPDETS